MIERARNVSGGILWKLLMLLASLFVNTLAAAEPERRYYYPGTETLADDEVRIIALGTGRPLVQRGQASACWLVQLGNGENFLFDMGTGCTPNLSLLATPWDQFDKVFLTHLHSDHFGDFGALYVAGVLAGRNKPIRVWGPSGTTPELGTAAAIEHIEKAYLWDKRSRQGRVPVTGMETIVTEFDYTKVQTIYEENGVEINSWPAIHTIDGPVSFSLQWRDFKFVFSGDTVPNQWFLDNARDADFLIHECFNSVRLLMKNYSAPSSWIVGTRVHTSPQAAGRLFSMLKPAHAVCYHFINDEQTLPDQIDAVRSTYEGPLSMAQDMMVWNWRAGEVQTRMTVAGESLLAIGARKVPPDPKLRIEQSPWLQKGVVPMPEVDQIIIDDLPKSQREELLREVPPQMLPGTR